MRFGSILRSKQLKEKGEATENMVGCMVGRILGSIIGFYLVYLLFALVFRHKIGLIIAFILTVIAGVLAIVYRQDPQTLLGALIGAVIVLGVDPIKIRNKGKNSDNENNKF